jgi:hypothetical protein
MRHVGQLLWRSGRVPNRTSWPKEFLDNPAQPDMNVPIAIVAKLDRAHYLLTTLAMCSWFNQWEEYYFSNLNGEVNLGFSSCFQYLTSVPVIQLKSA